MYGNNTIDNAHRWEQRYLAPDRWLAELQYLTRPMQLNLLTERPMGQRAMSFPLHGKTIFGIPQENGSNFGNFARQMNYAAIPPMNSVTMKMLHPYPTEICED